MKKIFILALTLFFLTPTLVPVEAHEVLPAKFIQFKKENPDATPAEFKVFLDANPELKQDKDFLAHVELVQKSVVNFWHNVRDFIKLGIQHILSGTDHILFVFSILLVYASFKREVILLSMFTIAHSISLILAGSGILTLSSKIVEPVVALSITYVAMTSVFLDKYKMFARHGNKISTVFLFGLFHGLGFAGLMKDISVPDDRLISSLLSFNIGIELGQFMIVAAILPFIYFFRVKPWYPTGVKIVAVIISIIGLVWGFQRIVA